MRLEDIPAVLEIDRASFAKPWSSEDYRCELSRNVAARYLVAEQGGSVIGFAGAWIILDESHITNIAVSPIFRGKGIGSRLTEELLQYISNLGAAYATLEVRVSNAPAVGMYKKYGFVAVGKRKRYYEDNNEDALLMVCDRLPPAHPDFTEPETVYEDTPSQP